MNDKDYTLDLPIPLRTDDLPIPAAEVAPRHEIASPCYSQWLNLANQCHIRSLAIDPLRGDLWLATGVASCAGGLDWIDILAIRANTGYPEFRSIDHRRWQRSTLVSL